MIRNEQEHEAAVARLAEMDAEVSARLEELSGEGAPPQYDVELWQQAEGLRALVERYEGLRTGEITLLAAGDVAAFGESLVEARIARRMGESELAAAVGVPPGEIGRHERDGYRDAPLGLVSEVARALGEEASLALRLPAPARAVPWSVLEEVAAGRPVELLGDGKLTLQPRQTDGGDPSPEGPGDVDVRLLYDLAEGADPHVRVGLAGRDEAGAEIVFWRPKVQRDRTFPRYDFSGWVDTPVGRVPARMGPLYLNFRNQPKMLPLAFDEAHALSAGPGTGSAPRRLRALVPNLHADADGEAGGLRFRLRPTGEVQPDGLFPDQVGKILPGSFLELERAEGPPGEEADLEEAVEAFGWFLSFFAGRAAHPTVWEAETPDGPYWTVQSLRPPSPLPREFQQTCLLGSLLGPFLERAWASWVGFGGERRRRLQGAVNAYESILTTRYPTIGVALAAMYLERLRDHVLGGSELVELGGNKRKKVARELRDALAESIRDSTRLDSREKEALAGPLENSGVVLGLFRKSFKASLLELHERMDLPADERRIGEFIRQRDLVIHGSWDATGAGTMGTYWVMRHGTAMLERLILRRFGYSGLYWDRTTGQGETLPPKAPARAKLPPGA